VQAAAAVHRPELGVLHERAHARVHAAAGVLGRLAGLVGVQGGELVGGRPDGGGRRVQGRPALRHRRAGPAGRGPSSGRDGLVTSLG
jgi:hypothetical protein